MVSLTCTLQHDGCAIVKAWVCGTPGNTVFHTGKQFKAEVGYLVHQGRRMELARANDNNYKRLFFYLHPNCLTRMVSNLQKYTSFMCLGTPLQHTISTLFLNLQMLRKLQEQKGAGLCIDWWEGKDAFRTEVLHKPEV